MANQQEHNELAKKTYERMKALSQGLTAQEATRTACRLSKWANPSGVQWKDINNEITKDMIVQVWPCSENEIKKGRWKIAKCENDDIKAHSERIFLEVYGHPLHNADATLYFAKMLYMQFVMGRPVDFASRQVSVNTHDLREETVTFTREELSLMVEGASLELNQVRESLEAKLVEKEQEASRLSQLATPPPKGRSYDDKLDKMAQDMNTLSQRMHPMHHGNHISHFLSHPEVMGVVDTAAGSSTFQCPHCFKVFDGWSGHYMLPCGHYYHLVCLVRQMQLGPTCVLCGAAIKQELYNMFGMASDYKTSNTTPSALRNLFQDEN